ncbi:beta-N-acetylhexosaminidase [Sphingomonas sp.]|jgi:beta-N-acetylhexosaminidase|uniref:beta-N-acetylhexosaminidase n=1 Tax=Sphingomonas sp. TaxID=28214 RepID=UPI002DEEDC7C|nr:beta-N-acetylhexosaminidase [Sphingomonas sp.]HEV2568878.1 beta-N-acetylhexosaminidase [Sphingomonas sp.]
MKPVIFGMAGLELSPDERAFFRDADPAGYILFKRNCGNREQMRALTDSLRDLHGRDDLLIMIDQEGGRVARMQPPEWPAFPNGAVFGDLYEKAPISGIEAARANAEAIGLALSEVGITVDALPLLDVRQPGANDVIGDRAYGYEPMRVAAIGRAVLEGLQAGGVTGIVKHMPGHGRVLVDSHKALPVVDASEAELESDIAPFRQLNWAPIGMTAHIVYTAWDDARPGTLSHYVVQKIIRERIGFDGLLMTDDIDMKALSGTPAEKACGAVDAGVDLVLDCWARMDEMVAIAEKLPDAGERTKERLAAALAFRKMPAPVRFAELVRKRDELLGLA